MIFVFASYCRTRNDHCPTSWQVSAEILDKEDTMGSHLFSWILAAGIFSMLWFSLSFDQGGQQALEVSLRQTP